nr:probable serine/threonine-protein kinase NAK [Tanacetum cinerariifolium]
MSHNDTLYHLDDKSIQRANQEENIIDESGMTRLLNTREKSDSINSITTLMIGEMGLGRTVEGIVKKRHFKAGLLYVEGNNYNTKLFDFGLAKDGLVGDKSHVSTHIMGTYGFAAPEYIVTEELFKIVIMQTIRSQNHGDESSTVPHGRAEHEEDHNSKGE